jgi:uncharacterized protein (TIRG00374 family)
LDNFLTALPTTVGGDASRAYDVAAYSKEAAASVTSVLMDRLIGVFALSLLAFFSLLIGYQLGEDISFFVFPVVVVFAISFASLVFILNAALVSKVKGILNRMRLARLAGQIEVASLSLRRLNQQKGVLLLAFVVSLALQINVVLFYYLISVSLHIDISLVLLHDCHDCPGCFAAAFFHQWHRCPRVFSFTSRCTGVASQDRSPYPGYLLD